MPGIFGYGETTGNETRDDRMKRYALLKSMVQGKGTPNIPAPAKAAPVNIESLQSLMGDPERDEYYAQQTEKVKLDMQTTRKAALEADEAKMDMTQRGIAEHWIQTNPKAEYVDFSSWAMENGYQVQKVPGLWRGINEDIEKLERVTEANDQTAAEGINQFKLGVMKDLDKGVTVSPARMAAAGFSKGTEKDDPVKDLREQAKKDDLKSLNKRVEDAWTTLNDPESTPLPEEKRAAQETYDRAVYNRNKFLEDPTAFGKPEPMGVGDAERLMQGIIGSVKGQIPFKGRRTKVTKPAVGTRTVLKTVKKGTVLDEATATEILIQSGGDHDEARRRARKLGYEIPLI